MTVPYLGTWASSGSRSVPLEIDIYSGYEFTISKHKVLEAKITGFIYPHVSDDDTLEGTLNATIYSTRFGYNYDFVLKQHYFELGIQHQLTESIFGKIRAGLLHLDDEKEKRPGASIKPAGENTIWDVELKLGYMITESTAIFGDYVDHETEGPSFSLGLITKFSLL